MVNVLFSQPAKTPLNTCYNFISSPKAQFDYFLIFLHHHHQSLRTFESFRIMKNFQQMTLIFHHISYRMLDSHVIHFSQIDLSWFILSQIAFISISLPKYFVPSVSIYFDFFLTHRHEQWMTKKKKIHFQENLLSA